MKLLGGFGKRRLGLRKTADRVRAWRRVGTVNSLRQLVETLPYVIEPVQIPSGDADRIGRIVRRNICDGLKAREAGGDGFGLFSRRLCRLGRKGGLGGGRLFKRLTHRGARGPNLRRQGELFLKRLLRQGQTRVRLDPQDRI